MFRRIAIRMIFGFAALVATLGQLSADAAAEAAFVGLQIQGINAEVAAALGLDREDGAMVSNVALDGPANRAGFLRGDIILSFAGKDIARFQDLLAMVGGIEAGDAVDVVVLRAGRQVSLTLETGKRPDAWRVSKDAFAEVGELGLTLATLTPKVRDAFELPWGTVGVLVSLVDPERAEGVGLQRSDVIVQVNQRNVWLPEHVLDAITDAKSQGGKDLLLLVAADGRYRFTLLPLR
jgi:serine protease Do